MALTEKDKARFKRQIILKELGEEGQQKLADGKVLIIGAGGLGSPLCLYLAAAGVGTIGVIDADAVDVSNLQRQVIHATKDEGMPKVDSAKARMQSINPAVKVITYQEFFTPDNAPEIIKGYDFIIDATDNFKAKYLINDVCVAAQKPFSYAGALRFEGMTMTCLQGTKNIRDAFGDIPQPGDYFTSAQVGILGTTPGILGTIQATEAIKFLSGMGELLTDKLLSFDTLTMDFNVINL